MFPKGLITCPREAICFLDHALSPGWVTQMQRLTPHKLKPFCSFYSLNTLISKKLVIDKCASHGRGVGTR